MTKRAMEEATQTATQDLADGTSRTTIVLPTEYMASVKAIAALKETTVRSLLEEIIGKYLESKETKDFLKTVKLFRKGAL